MDNLILAFAIDGEDTIGIKAESKFLVEASSPHVELLDSDIGFRVTKITKEAQSLSPEFLAGACPEVVRMDVDGPDLSDLLFASTVLAVSSPSGSSWIASVEPVSLERICCHFSAKCSGVFRSLVAAGSRSA